MRCWILLVALGMGCSPDAGKDPVRVAMRVRASRGLETLTWDTLELGVRAVRFRPCAPRDDQLDWPGLPPEVGVVPRVGAPPGTVANPRKGVPQPWIVGLDNPYNTLLPPRVRAPLGPWCALDLVMQGGLVGHGALPDGTTIDLDLSFPDLGLPGDVEFGADSGETTGKANKTPVVVPVILDFGAPEWLASVQPALDAGQDVSIGPDSAEHDALVAALLSDAGLYSDLDANGQLSDDERAGARLSDLTPIVSAAARGVLQSP